MPRVEVYYDKAADCYDLKFLDVYGSNWTLVSQLVTLLKGTIPVNQRSYDPKTKQWAILAQSYPIAKKLLETAHFKIEEKRPISSDGFFYEDTTSATNQPTRKQLEEKLILLLSISAPMLADESQLKKAYRRKALELHPDRNNGDGSKMSELNEVYNAYTRN
jgi:hypothetical protein